jgi:hypothetical protein
MVAVCRNRLDGQARRFCFSARPARPFEYFIGQGTKTPSLKFKPLNRTMPNPYLSNRQIYFLQ